MNSSISSAPRRKALLLGIPSCDAENVSKLSMVENDIVLMQSALKHSKYEIGTAGLSPETKLTRTNLLRRIRQFSKSSEEGETLIIYYSGHGLHYSGVDYVIPTDAAFD
jgi:hypothetical protein